MKRQISLFLLLAVLLLCAASSAQAAPIGLQVTAISIDIAAPATVASGGTVAYAVTVRSDSTASTITDISVILDPSLTPLSFSMSDGQCVLGFQLLSCRSTVKDGAPAQVFVTARAPTSAHCTSFVTYASFSAPPASGIVESLVQTNDARCTPRVFLPLIELAP